MPSGSLFTLRAFAQKRGVAAFVEDAGGRGEDGVRRIGFRCRESIFVQFEEKNANDETRALVPVDERMILDDSDRASARQIDQIRIRLVIRDLARTRDRGVQ